VLAVGDASFQQKCFEVFQRLKDAGKTILFVTHDMGLVERFCDRAMLIERGKVLSIGHPHEIGLLYNQVNFGGLVHDAPAHEATQRPVEIRTCRVEAAGEAVSELPHGETFDIAFEMLFNERTEDPVFGVSLRNEAGQTVFATTTQWSMPETGVFEAGESVTVRVQLDAWFSPSRYRVSPSVARQGSGADTLDLREDMASVIVHSTRDSGGMLDLPHRFEIERAGVPAR
jgi:ABC-type glutathione transport system ATPase component